MKIIKKYKNFIKAVKKGDISGFINDSDLVPMMDLFLKSQVYENRSRLISLSEKLFYVKPNLASPIARYFYSKSDYLNTIKYYSSSKSLALADYDFQIYSESLIGLAYYSDARKLISNRINGDSQNLIAKLMAVKLEVVTRHLYNIDKSRIISNIKSIYPSLENSKQYALIAGCLNSVGEFDASINAYMKALSIIKCVEKDIKNNKFNDESTKALMDILIDYFSKKGIAAFPFFGSLLGLKRDGKLISHDKDADICVFRSDINDIYELCKEVIFDLKLACPAALKESREYLEWCVSFHDKVTGAVVDIFFIHEESNLYKAGIHNECGILKWNFEKFKINIQSIAGLIYHAPEDIPKVLNEIYGSGWTKKDSAWDSLINAYNIEAESRPVVLFYALDRLHTCLLNLDYEKAINYFESLKNRWGLTFEPNSEANIIAQLENIKFIRKKNEILG